MSLRLFFYDHRGNGRSEGDDPTTWNLMQWADDVKGLCDGLGIIRPIGAVSRLALRRAGLRHPLP